MDCDAYFDDAYTQPAYIAAEAELLSAVRFRYRPALIEERSRLIEARRGLVPQVAERRLAEFTARRIASWDLADHAGQPLAISAASMLQCRREMFRGMAAIVLGYACSDVDPAWPRDIRDEQIEAAARAARSGLSVAESREEIDERQMVLGVSLLLAHPRLAERTCDRCRQWMYGDDHRIQHWNRRPLRRPAASPTPCWRCPKKNPAAGAVFERMLPRAERLVDFYFRVRATWGRALDDRLAADTHLLRDLAIVDRLMVRWERARAAGRQRGAGPAGAAR